MLHGGRTCAGENIFCVCEREKVEAGLANGTCVRFVLQVACARSPVQSLGNKLNFALSLYSRTIAEKQNKKKSTWLYFMDKESSRLTE